MRKLQLLCSESGIRLSFSLRGTQTWSKDGEGRYPIGTLDTDQKHRASFQFDCCLRIPSLTKNYALASNDLMVRIFGTKLQTAWTPLKTSSSQKTFNMVHTSSTFRSHTTTTRAPKGPKCSIKHLWCFRSDTAAPASCICPRPNISNRSGHGTRQKSHGIDMLLRVVLMISLCFPRG